MSSIKVDIEKFSGKNDFCLWREKMRANLGNLGLDDALNKDATKPEGIDQREWENMLKKARNTIILCLEDEILRNVVKEATAYDMWNRLEQMFMTKSLPSRVYLKQKFYGFKMDEGKSLDDNLNDFYKLVSDLSSLEVQIEEEDKAIYLLNSLPSQYEQFKDTIIYSKDTLVLDEIVGAIYSKELSLKQTGRALKSNSEAYYSRGRQQFRGNNNQEHGKKRRSQSAKGRWRSQSRGPRTNSKCYHCGKIGHIKKYCYDLTRKPKDSRTSDQNSQDQDNAANYSEQCEDGDVFVAEVPEVLTTIEQKNEWIIDSGCNFHMTNNKSWIRDLRHQKIGKVIFGNGQTCAIEGIGNVMFRLDDGTLREIKDVRYVPNLARNLISLSMFDDAGFEFKGNAGCMKICKGSLVVLKGIKQGGLYYLKGEALCGDAAVAISNKEDRTELWHKRLGHISEKGIHVLNSKEAFGKDKISHLPFCEYCILGKQHRVKFQTGTHKSKHNLEYLHADLWGPEKVKTFGGSAYFLSIIDDHSRKVWVHLLKHKNDAFKAFKNWKNLTENETGNKIKVLRTDNGLEFCNDEFNQFCLDHGIDRHRTVRMTPQQNGVAERMNRTLLEKARCMLLSSGLPKGFWGEAIMTAAYLINRCPSRAINLKTPEEQWSGKVPNLSHLKVFGCTAFVHQSIGKLEPRSSKCIFLGYPHGVKGYRVWDKSRGGFKVIISRDIIFNENEFPCKTNMDAGHRNQKEMTKDAGLEKESVQVEQIMEEHDDNRTERGDQSQVEPIQEISEEEYEQPERTRLEDYMLTRDRPRREPKPVNKLSLNIWEDIIAYAFYTAMETCRKEPENYEEALKSSQAGKWITAMNEEMASLMKNKTWELVPRPKNNSVISNKWLYKLKDEEINGEKVRYKARLVAKGFTQREGVDFNEIFSPVVKYKTIRIMLSIVVQFDMELEQMDVKTAFLHGELEEVIYMEQPRGYEQGSPEGTVCKLKKALYGLKQAPRQWNKKFDSFMMKQGFQKSLHDTCLYYKGSKIEDSEYLLLYVDDMLLISKSKTRIENLKRILNSEFDMKDLGTAKKILGMELKRNRNQGTITISQKGYIDKVLNRFAMKEAKSTKQPMTTQHQISSKQCPETVKEKQEMKKVPYDAAVGSIIYLMVCSRPDLAHSISCLSRYMANPGKEHWQAMKWLMRYLIGTSKEGLIYKRQNEEISIEGFSDSDYAGDKDTRRSTSAYQFLVCGNCVSWKTQLQTVVALSTTEAEFMAATDAIKECLWIQGLLKELKIFEGTAEINLDSQSAIHLCKNPMYHDRTKHIDIKYFFIREKVTQEVVRIEKVHTDDNPADMGTKVVTLGKFNHCKDLLRIGVG